MFHLLPLRADLRAERTQASGSSSLRDLFSGPMPPAESSRSRTPLPAYAVTRTAGIDLARLTDGDKASRARAKASGRAGQIAEPSRPDLGFEHHGHAVVEFGAQFSSSSNRFAIDSPLEGARFEPSVPGVMEGDSGRLVAALIAVLELAGTAVAKAAAQILTPCVRAKGASGTTSGLRKRVFRKDRLDSFELGGCWQRECPQAYRWGVTNPAGNCPSTPKSEPPKTTLSTLAEAGSIRTSSANNPPLRATPAIGLAGIGVQIDPETGPKRPLYAGAAISRRRQLLRKPTETPDFSSRAPARYSKFSFDRRLRDTVRIPA
jgi:hypothetical protein